MSLEPLLTSDRSLILVMDRQVLPASRRQLAAWSARCRRRKGLGFITGVQLRTVQRISRGLKLTIYNAGARELLPLTELLAWMDWRTLVIIENGYCWEMPLARIRNMTRLEPKPAIEPDRLADLYRHAGLIYQDI